MWSGQPVYALPTSNLFQVVFVLHIFTDTVASCDGCNLPPPITSRFKSSDKEMACRAAYIKTELAILIDFRFQFMTD